MDSIESAVRRRYSAGARRAEAALRCPTSSCESKYLEAIPAEILERDYGCGDPTRYIQPGETVLDLGSGGGKSCYIAAQVVGPEGRVIGVDCNRDMLALARRHLDAFAARVGYHNVAFYCGLIQDLRLDLDELAGFLSACPVRDQWGYLELRDLEDRLRREDPMIPDASIDCVISNCVLNLVRPEDKSRLFSEVFRVLKPGGRAVISDIVSDADVPADLQADPELWSGCLSGALREDAFLSAFESAGFSGVHLAERRSEPWRTVRGIAFRSVTVLASKGELSPSPEPHQALVYTGPFRLVEDDAGHRFPRGRRVAVSATTFHLLQRPPYEGMFTRVDPLTVIPTEQATPSDGNRSSARHPHATEDPGDDATADAAGDCGSGGCC
ncbi:MAG TPA: methyltransferase domain-containing protein [Isosphaeraceae bacterium]